MEKWKGKIINAQEVAQLYAELAHQWLLLNVTEKRPDGKAEKFQLIANANTKDELYNIIMDEEVENSNNLIFVFADPNGICEI